MSEQSDDNDDQKSPPPINPTDEARAAVRNISALSDDDSDDAPSAAVRRTDEAKAAARKITALSDDDSDDAAPAARPSYRPPSSSPRHRTPSPRGDSPHRGQSPRRDRSADHHMSDHHMSDRDDENPPSDQREMSPPLADCYQRFAGTHAATPRNVHMMHFPPNISFSMTPTDKLDTVPKEQNPILYRLKPQLRGDNTTADAIMDLIKKNPDPLAWKNFFQSNANLVTWSDGSKTIAIGSQQFLLIEDAMVSKHHLFRRGDKIQTYEAHIDKVVRVQPSSTGGADVKLAMANAAKKAAGMRRAGRTMMRCMDKDGERQEEKAKQDFQRRERERLRLEVRRRRARERHVRPNRGLTVDALESNDEDSGDDHVRRIEERVGANRLMRAKRAAPLPPRPGISAKRRKAGRRKFVGSDDDDDADDSADSDL